MRDTIFISHANPEDNEFSRWLALQLAREGYPVWCDLVKLVGGEDFWADIEKVIRTRTVKFLYVLTRTSNQKPGVLQELTVAQNVARDLALVDFILPLHVDDIPHREINIQLSRLNTIEFKRGWAPGFANLLRKLDEDGIAKSPAVTPASVTCWWRTHFSATEGVSAEPEEYLSNWFPITSWPDTLYFHQLSTSPGNLNGLLADIPYPAFMHRDNLVSFASADDLSIWQPSGCSIVMSAAYSLADIVQSRSRAGFADYRDARNGVTRLLRQAWYWFLAEHDFPTFSLSSEVPVFYFTKDAVEKDTIRFEGVDGKTAHRQIVGYKTSWSSKANAEFKRYWHFGVQLKPLVYPLLAFAVKPHVFFSEDGTNLWDHPSRMHRARRSQCKDWWNPHWRDRILAAMTLLAGPAGDLELPVSAEARITVGRRPVKFVSPVSFSDPEGRAPSIVEDDRIDDFYDDSDDGVEEEE